MIEGTSFCAARARETAQPLAGTAVRGRRYIFLPVRKSLWGSVDLDFSWAPEGIAEFIKMQRRGGTVTRFYNPLPRSSGGDLAIIAEKGAVGTKEMAGPWHEDIAALESLYAIAPAEAAPDRSPQSIIAVCTHGTRDRCCAKWGFATFQKLRRDLAEDPVMILESSHLGGDRLAATAVGFPGGHMYGHLAADLDYSDWRDTNFVFRWDKFRGTVFEEPAMQLIRAGLGLQGVGRGDEPLDLSAVPDGAERQEIPFRFDGRDGIAHLKLQEFEFYGDCRSIQRHKLSINKRLVLESVRLSERTAGEEGQVPAG